MTKFEFYSVPRIVFGRGAFVKAGELAKGLGDSALIVYNGFEEQADQLVSLVSTAGLRWEEYRQRGEPKVEDVDAAAQKALRCKCDIVIGLGGGSAIDTAKTVAALLTNGGSALDYMEVVGKGQKIKKQAAPWIAIPTTAGTGAEATRNAVIGSAEGKFKASIRGEQLLARIAVIDPELTVTTPPAVTASSGMDALCQCIEAYTSNGAQNMSDALALQGMRLAAKSLLAAYADPQNLDAREDMSMAALYSGIALTNAGLGAVHGFAAPLGANYPAPHGTICAALLPHVVAANIQALRAADPNHALLKRYCVIGRALAGTVSLSPPEAIDAAIHLCGYLGTQLQIPQLREFGLTEASIAPMVAQAKRASSMKYNPIPLPDDVLAEVLRKAIGEES